MISCSNNSPSKPSNPTDTPTVCTDGSGHTCTPTFTLTGTDTATTTATSTPTNTATVTDTRTSTSSPTNTSTPTATGTPTNTATITDTATVTNTPTVTDTPTDTLSPTPTGSATSTFTQTFTPTASNTQTSSPTQTYSPTPDCTGSYSIGGTIVYQGSSISGDALAALAIPPSQLTGGSANNCGTPDYVIGLVGPGSYAYSLTNLPAGSYYLVGAYGTFGTGGPNLGAYVGDDGNNCAVTASTQITVSSGNPSVSNVNVTISGTLQLWGVNAAVTYTGPTSNGSLQFGIFSALNTSAGTDTLISGNGLSGTSGISKAIDADGACTSGTSVYAMAWYGDSNGGPNPGDPYGVCCGGSTTTEVDNTTSVVDITFSNSTTWK